MSNLAQASRLFVFARHAETPANRAKYEGSAGGRVQGLSPDMPIIYPDGHIQAHAFGIALGRFVSQHSIDIVEVHASATVRTETSRALALRHVLGLTVIAPTEALWEHRKGKLELGGLEGMERAKAYPTEEIRRRAAEDPGFRHGTHASGGETPNEAGDRWLQQWFYPLLEQPDFQPRENPELPIPTVVAFGHNLVTARGISWLMHDGVSALPPVSDRTYKVDNGTALLLAEQGGQWSALPERLAPTPTEFEEARAYVTGE